MWLDLPFLLLGLLAFCSIIRSDLVVAAVYQGTNTNARRKAVAREAGLLFLTLLSFPVSAAIMATLYRFPRFLASLCASVANTPLDGQPLLQATSSQISFPEDAKPLLRIQTKRDKRVSDVGSIASLSVHQLGGPFWSELEGTFGMVVTDIGKALMPLSMLSEGDPKTDHTDLEALNISLQAPPQEVPDEQEEPFSFEIRVGRVGMRNAGPSSTTRKYVEQALGMAPEVMPQLIIT